MTEDTAGSQEPQGSYIDRYVAWASKLTIAPTKYHVATALAHLSALVNRNAYIDFSWKTYYPNLWILVTGKTRISKKSTATEDIGKEKIFTEVDNDCLLPSDITPPMLFKILHDRSEKCLDGKGMIYTDEIGGFFAKLGRADFMEGGKDFLCNLYNCPEEITKATKIDGILKIDNAYITILGNTTMDRLSKVIKEDDFQSGFMPRFLIFDAPVPDNNYQVNYYTDEMEKERKELIKWLEIFKDSVEARHPRFELSEEAEAIYIEYQKSIDAKIRDENRYYLAELPNQLIKIAILYELSMLSISSMLSMQSILSISKDSILKAKEICDSCALTVITCIDNIDTLTINKITNKIASMLTNTPQKPTYFQHRIYGSNINEINEALRKLERNGTAKIIGKEGYALTENL